MPSDCCYFVVKAAAADAAPALNYFSSILHRSAVFTQNLGQTPGWRKVLLQRIVLSDGTGIYEPINLFTIREIDTTLTYLPPLQANKKELPDF